MLLEKIAVLSRSITTKKKSASKGVSQTSPSSSSEKQSSHSAWFDDKSLSDLTELGDGPEFIQSLVRNFIADGKKHVARIKDSANSDYLEYWEALHALKGSSTELGAKKLVQVCIKGESLKPYDIGTDKVFQVCSEIEFIFSETAKALSKAVDISTNEISLLPKR